MLSRTLRLVLILTAGAMIIGAAGCAKPKVNVTISRDRIQQGENVQVVWSSQKAKEVTLNGDRVEKTGVKVFTPDKTTTYTAVAKRGKKEARSAKTVEVVPPPPRPAISISADPGAITSGQESALTWSSANATQVNITDIGNVPASGTRQVNPASSTTYTATATGPGGTETASARVTVTEPVTDGRPRTTSTTSITALFAQWVQPIYFDFDKADLSPRAQDNLRRAAEWLTTSANRTIVFRIEGNCDPRGTSEYNLGLGERRAQTAREFLVSLGVESSRIMTVSYGIERAQGTYEGNPDSPPSWAHDRRDDFIYISGGESSRNSSEMIFIIGSK